MRVPLLDLNAQLEPIERELQAAVSDVIRSGRYVMGSWVGELESAIAEYVGVSYGIGVSSGTDALLVSLMALEVGAGDLVITTPYSFFATAGVIHRLGAKPVFVDIDPKTYNIDPTLLTNWFEQHKGECHCVKAIMPVHLYGQCAAMAPILKIANDFGIPIIEDAAQAIGAQYELNGEARSAGSMGLMGCFSFFPSKNLGGVGDGGMVVTSDEQLAKKLQMLRNHGAEPKYYHALVGGNFRLDSIQAAALLVKLRHLDKWHRGRQENAHYYNQLFADTVIATPYLAAQPEYHIYNQYIISVPERRDELRAFLVECQIGAEVYYPVPFHLQECFQDLGYKLGDFPFSEYAAAHTLALPIYPELTKEMQDYVVEKIIEFYA